MSQLRLKSIAFQFVWQHNGIYQNWNQRRSAKLVNKKRIPWGMYNHLVTKRRSSLQFFVLKTFSCLEHLYLSNLRSYHEFFKARSSPSKIVKICFKREALKWWKMIFISRLKLFSFLRYINFCPNFFVHVGKRLHTKAKVNFKVYDITDWQINNCNTHIAQYLKR